MMWMRWSAMLALVWPLLPVSAQRMDEGWYGGMAAGALRADSGFGLPRPGPAIGLRFGVPLTPDWDLQLGTAYGHSWRAAERYQQSVLHMDALYMLAPGGIRPFLLVGGGLQQDKHSGVANAPAPQLQLSAGLGVRWQLDARWDLQADLRRIHGFRRGELFDLRSSNNHYLMFGANYRFGAGTGRASMLPAVAAVLPPALVRPAPQLPPPVASAVPDVPPAPVVEPAGVTIGAVVPFALGRTELPADHHLAAVAERLREQPALRVRLTGYADHLGKSAGNHRLSLRRALAVRAYLVAHGVDKQRINASGGGILVAPPACQATPAGAALWRCLEGNRRVDVFLSP